MLRVRWTICRYFDVTACYYCDRAVVNINPLSEYRIAAAAAAVVIARRNAKFGTDD